MPRKKGFHTLKRFKIRQTWNKHNLYNLSRLQKIFTSNRTFFQQKWTAKAEARAYHGEQIREGQWTRMFSRYIPAVVPMDANQLAKDDGSAQGAGRGSGRDVQVAADADGPTKGTERARSKTPYMSMTFYPAEKRLDTAIFRALFASSARQARQLCVHGFVKVNGKKMKYPGYLLNPGDMFSVDPDMVMFATGNKKMASSKKGQLRRVKARDLYIESCVKRGMTAEEARIKAEREEEGETSGEVMNAQEVEEDPFDEVWEDEQEADDVEDSNEGHTESEVDTPEMFKARRKELIALRDEVKEVATTDKDVRGRRKRQLRKLFKDMRKVNFKRIPEQDLTEFKDRFEWLKELMRDGPDPLVKEVAPTKEPKELEEDSLVQDRLTALRKNPHLAALVMWPNKRDKSKPYETPWLPRPYMSAFAFIPRYLEVNQNVCSAVYLRDPVARPGSAEVPSPFAPETNQLAFQWYLKRR